MKGECNFFSFRQTHVRERRRRRRLLANECSRLVSLCVFSLFHPLRDSTIQNSHGQGDAFFLSSDAKTKEKRTHTHLAFAVDDAHAATGGRDGDDERRRIRIVVQHRRHAEQWVRAGQRWCQRHTGRRLHFYAQKRKSLVHSLWRGKREGREKKVKK
jgi:hypothetical protein